MNKETLLFATSEDFRLWLAGHADNAGVWLTFGKKGGPKTLTAAEALEEALCFGWIDGQMQSVDENSYIKYFAPRRAQSKWSDKNKRLVADLEKQGKMTDTGRASIEEAKKRGTWDAPQRVLPTEEQVQELAEALRGNEPAYTNFMAMTPSVKRTYTGAYLDVKSEEARQRRLADLIERFTLNLNPMESLTKKKRELS